MAEIAIPIVALGALYILSNIDKNNTSKTINGQENFENIMNYELINRLQF